MVESFRVFSKTLGDAERAWFAPTFASFGAACPSYGIGLALGALSLYDAEVVVSSCTMELAPWTPCASEWIEARVSAEAGGWRVDAGGLRGRFGTGKPACVAAPASQGIPLSFGDHDRVMGCGLCGIATSAALSRKAALAQGYSDMILPLHILARAALHHAAMLRVRPPARLQMWTSAVAVREPLSLHCEVSDGKSVVHLSGGGQVRASIELTGG